MRALPPTLSKGGSKTKFVVLGIKIEVQSHIKSATKFLYVKTSSSRIVAEPFPYLTVYISWR